MTELGKGPRGQRQGRGARERILGAAQQLFREQGINGTGMDQLCALAHVSKRTAYQHFASKDELVTEYLRQLEDDPTSAVLRRDDLTPRERLLAVFLPPAAPHGGLTPLCPFIGAAVELVDPAHPARAVACDYKLSVAARLADTARDAGAAEPELLGEQLAQLPASASTRTRALQADAYPTAAGIAAVLIEAAVPSGPVPRPRRGAAR